MENGKSGAGIYIDLIGSRKIESRDDLDFRVNNLKDFFSQHPDWGVFTIWKGLDEFIILSPGWEFAIKSVIKVQELLHPYEQRFVLTGFENIDFGKPVHEMDRREFGILADAMVMLKKSKLYFDIVSVEPGVLFESVSVIVNALISIKSSFTVSQMDVYCQHKAGKNQVEISREINKSQQYVSKTLDGIKAENLDVWEEKLLKIVAYGIDKGDTD